LYLRRGDRPRRHHARTEYPHISQRMVAIGLSPQSFETHRVPRSTRTDGRTITFSRKVSASPPRSARPERMNCVSRLNGTPRTIKALSRV
jgi:hypothetical protein